MYDVAVAGGGPAGLAAAIHAARRNLSVVVLERASEPPDKVCGEGLLPQGAHELESLLGARHRELLGPEDSAAFAGIRYMQEDGASVEARFSRGRGLGVCRPVLSAALASAARETGVKIHMGAAVTGTELGRDSIKVATSSGTWAARILVAADGRDSPLRREAGLDGPPAGGRFGLRRRLRVRPWTDLVEVHWARGADAYVTPIGRGKMNVLFQWDPRELPRPVSFDALLRRFPLLHRRVEGVSIDSPARGLGPLCRLSRARAADRLVLIGDAAGFIDGIAGNGLTAAFLCARALGELLPSMIAAGAGASALGPYESAYRRIIRGHALVTKGLLALGRRHRMRRALIRYFARHPKAFGAIVDRAAGMPGGKIGRLP